jgi:hypothetical protein
MNVGLLRLAFLVGLFVSATLLSYRMATGLRSSGVSALASAVAIIPDSPVVAPYASGQYLVAIIFVASDCGISAHPTTTEALRQVPGLLRTGAAADFSNVSVLGVALDTDLGAGARLLQQLQQPGSELDEVSVGSGWLNEQVIRFMWRDGSAAPLLPQVVLIERSVDARMYPAHIEVGDDAVVLNVVGRDDILQWVDEGAPLDFGKSQS